MFRILFLYMCCTVFFYTVFLVGCSRSTDVGSQATFAGEDVDQPITHGRVSITGYQVEAGNPDGPAVREGLHRSAKYLNILLENGYSAKGQDKLAYSFTARFHVGTKGNIGQLVTDPGTAPFITNELAARFHGGASAGLCYFPKVGDSTIVQADFEISAEK